MTQTHTQRNKPTANRNAIADEYWDVQDSHSCRALYYNHLDLEPATAFLPSIPHEGHTPWMYLAESIHSRKNESRTLVWLTMRLCAFMLTLKLVWWKVPSSTTSVRLITIPPVHQSRQVPWWRVRNLIKLVYESSNCYFNANHRCPDTPEGSRQKERMQSQFTARW
jgi:hypothetical protein